MPTPVRLDKFLAHLTGCSRQDARLFIEGGFVRVDGVVTTRPQAMVGAQHVELDEAASAARVHAATVVLHKPAGMELARTPSLIAPGTRAAGDAEGQRMLPHHFAWLTPLLPMDAEASGLAVLSQDPKMRRRLEEDQAVLEQEYLVEVEGGLAEGDLERMESGLAVATGVLPRCKVSWQNETRLRVALKGNQPGGLRLMCEQVGLAVVSIRRLRIGRIAMGKMPVGEWRCLPPGARF